jgi:hypothetical protein
MTDRRRALIWFAALLALVFAGDRVLAWALDQVLVRSQFRFSRLYRGGNDADILVLGDSRGVHSFYQPEIEKLTGLRTFNLSYNSMSTRIAEAVLRDYLDHNRAPRLVVIEATCTIPGGALAVELRTFARFSPRLAALYAEGHPYGALTGRLLHLFPLNSEFYLEALHYRNQSDQDWINHSTMPAGLRAEQPGPWALPRPENLEAMNRIVALLRQRGIEVRLVIAPYWPVPVNMPAIANAIDVSVHRADPQLHVLNYASAVSDPEEFADRVHLNERGSVALLEILQRDGVFAIHASPPH